MRAAAAGARRRSAARSPGRLAAASGKYAAASLVAILTLFPLFWLVTTSFKNSVDIFRSPPALLVFEPTLENWLRTVVQNDRFLKYLYNSLVVAGGATFVTVAAASLAAYALARYDFVGSRLVSLGILAARLVPGATMIIPYFVLFRWYALVDSLGGLTLAYTGFSLPFACWLMYGFFLDVPTEVEESARIDGCSDLQAFLRVALPLTLPGVGTTAMLVFIGAWNEFLFALVLSGREAKTLPVFLASAIAEHYVRWGDLFAVATVMLVPVAVLVLLAQRSLVHGLTAGAVKG
jgi:multiple sugar transport system permease protein